MATLGELRRGLEATSVPAEVVDVLVDGASSLWLSSDDGALLAGDLALCHPPLKPHEVRARATNTAHTWRLTVVAHDRRGLLADTTAILAQRGFTVDGASVATWQPLDLALHAITVAGAPPAPGVLDEIGAALRAAGAGERPDIAFKPAGRASVKRSGVANGEHMINVVAPLQPGLLATVCRWLAEEGVSIEAAWVTREKEANDVFVIRGDVDVAALERVLSDGDHNIPGVVGDMVADARRAGESAVRAVFGAAGRLLRGR